MNGRHTPALKSIVILTLPLLLTSCTAGDAQFTAETPAGFWQGLWHGIIALVTLVIHVFNGDVLVYEVNNTGGWYDFGFLLGVICIWGGGSHVSCKSAAEKRREQEWHEVMEKVEKKVMRKLNTWAESEAGTESGEDWDEIGEKAEKKLKRIIREWAEKD